MSKEMSQDKKEMLAELPKPEPPKVGEVYIFESKRKAKVVHVSELEVVYENEEGKLIVLDVYNFLINSKKVAQ